MCSESVMWRAMARILVQVTINRRFLIGRDGQEFFGTNSVRHYCTYPHILGLTYDPTTLLYKAKRQYLLICQVSRCCLLALRDSIHVYLWITWPAPLATLKSPAMNKVPLCVE